MKRPFLSKVLMKSSVIIFFSALLFITACKNDDDNSQNCGCNAEAITTIQQLEGTLFPINFQNENIPPANFAIVWTDPEMPGWQTSYYICHDNLINELGEIPETGMEVVFSGNIKELCGGIITIPEHFHYRIELTQINTP